MVEQQEMSPIHFRVDVHVEGPNPNAPDPILTGTEWRGSVLIFANAHEAYSYIEDLRIRWNVRSAIVIPTPNPANARFGKDGLQEYKKE